VFTILLTKTTAKVAWQDQTEDVVAGTDVVPDYNMEDDNEVWPGELVVTNEKETTEEDWIFQPKRVGVVQSVLPADRIAKVKWLPNARIRYNQVGMDEQLEELSLLEGSTLALDTSKDADQPIEDVTLYDIRTIGALSRRRGDFVVVDSEGTGIDSDVKALEWFGEVVDLNLDGTLTIRLGAAKEVRDIRVTPEKTALVYSSDSAPSFLGDEGDFDEEDSEDESGSELDYDDDMSEVTKSDEGEWMVNGVPVAEDDAEWDTESSASDAVDKDVDMEDAPDRPALAVRAPNEEYTPKVVNGDAIPDLNIPLQESSVKIHGTEDAPPAFDVLEGNPPTSNPYLYPDPPALTGARLKRIRKEHTILSTSLPEGIFVRTWETRLDLLRILIVGPLGTPYEYAPFVIDMRIPFDYPTSPPEAHFHSWTSGQGPVNPNLYENGKICLSLLGTWHAGEKGENWSTGRSTILQVLVSILGLVLVREPYYNEAGYESRVGSEDAKVPSQLYSERTYFRSRAFITHALRNGVEGFDDLLKWLYHSQETSAPQLLEKSIDAARELIEAGEGGVDIRAGLKKMSRGAIIMLERQLRDLEQVKATKIGEINS
jgi:ubiquitin-conjugating enzyme E2 O